MVVFSRKFETVVVVITFAFQCSGFELIGSKLSILSENLRGFSRIRACQHIHRQRASLGLGMVEKSEHDHKNKISLVMDVDGEVKSLERRRLLLQSAISIASLGLAAPGSANGEGLASRLRYINSCR